MTPAQIAELEQLDAAIAAAPEAVTLLRARANFWADVIALDRTANKEALLADCLKMCALSAHHNSRYAVKYEWNWSCDQSLGAATRLYYRACAIASCILLLESDGDTKGWLSRESALALFAANARTIRDDFWQLRALEGASPVSYQVEALLLDVAQSWTAGAACYGAGLRLFWQPEQRGAAIRAHFLDSERWLTPDYQELAWHTLAIEHAPGEAAPVLQRARWLLFQVEDEAAARADLRWAAERFPRDIGVYEAKWTFAQWGLRQKWAISQQTLLEQSRDYQDLLRPALDAGHICATVESLVEYAQETLQRYDRWAQAHAYYSLAIERAAPTMELYLGRARVAQQYFQNSMEEESETNIGEQFEALTLDFARV